MPVRFRNYIKFIIAACLVVSFCLVDADAQTRRKKRTRRTSKPAVERPVITNPPIASPEETAPADSASTGDVKIISTADPTQEPTQTTQSKKAATSSDPDEMKHTINSLSNQVNKLNDRLSSMQEDDRYQLDMERLSRAEQRAEQLRSQLMEVQTKIADFESRIEQIDWALKPENIESSTAGYGSTRPEAAREARKKGLESEKARVTVQLKLAETSRTRLETAVTNADSEVDFLRQKLNQRREQMEAAPVETPATPPKPRKPE